MNQNVNHCIAPQGEILLHYKQPPRGKRTVSYKANIHCCTVIHIYHTKMLAPELNTTWNNISNDSVIMAAAK